MTDNQQTWFITGAGRGMGVDIAQAALAAGHAVVATGRDPDKVAAAIGAHDDLLTVALDITDPGAASAAVQNAVERFGGIDVLVNNAGNFYAGFFEEVPPEDFRAQIETNLLGPVNVTRAVLPLMRAQRSGLVITHLLDCRDRRPGVRLGLLGIQVRHRRLDRVPHPRDRPLRPSHDARRARLLPHGPPDERLHDLAARRRSTTTPTAPGRPSTPGRA